MTEYKFYMTRIEPQGDGTYVEGDTVSLEDDFAGLRYKSFSGLHDLGKPKAVYSESFAEEDFSRVYISPDLDVRESTELKLTLYFFPPEQTDDLAANILGARSVYDAFMDYLGSSGMVAYADTVRRMSALMYLSGSVEVSTDSVKGLPYMEAEYTFTNVFGRCFNSDADVSFAEEMLGFIPGAWNM